jgi:hypothetical protein
MSHDIIVICGPTASGKTALSVSLAKELGGEVVSADSMQIYRRMDIGTAKPTKEEMQGIPHHMIDVADPEENYSVARYVSNAVPIVDDIIARGKIPIVAGGTGLYIDNLIAGREFAPFEETSGGEGLPAGDTHIVYPFKQEPLRSLRFVQMLSGIEDYEILNAIAQKDKELADSLCKRGMRSFVEYITDVDAFDALEQELVSAYDAL